MIGITVHLERIHGPCIDTNETRCLSWVSTTLALIIVDEFSDLVKFERLLCVDLFHAPSRRIVNVNGHLQVAVVDRLNGLSNNGPDAPVLLGCSLPWFRIG